MPPTMPLPPYLNEMLLPTEQPLWDAMGTCSRAAAADCLARGRLDPRGGPEKDPKGRSWLEIAVDVGAVPVVDALIAAGASATQCRRALPPGVPAHPSPANPVSISGSHATPSGVGCPLWMDAGRFGVPSAILLALYRDPLITASLTHPGWGLHTPLEVVLCKRDPGPGKSFPEGHEGRDNLAECERLLASRPCTWPPEVLTAALSVATRLQWECPASLPRLALMGCVFDTAPRAVQEAVIELAAARATWQPPEGEIIACRATEWLLFFIAHPSPHVARHADAAVAHLLAMPSPLPLHEPSSIRRRHWLATESVARQLHRDMCPACPVPPRARL